MVSKSYQVVNNKTMIEYTYNENELNGISILDEKRLEEYLMSFIPEGESYDHLYVNKDWENTTVNVLTRENWRINEEKRYEKILKVDFEIYRIDIDENNILRIDGKIWPSKENIEKMASLTNAEDWYIDFDDWFGEVIYCMKGCELNDR